jgi:hypothetical protein
MLAADNDVHTPHVNLSEAPMSGIRSVLEQKKYRCRWHRNRSIVPPGSGALSQTRHHTTRARLRTNELEARSFAVRNTSRSTCIEASNDATLPALVGHERTPISQNPLIFPLQAMCENLDLCTTPVFRLGSKSARQTEFFDHPGRRGTNDPAPLTVRSLSTDLVPQGAAKRPRRTLQPTQPRPSFETRRSASLLRTRRQASRHFSARN